jgi:conjugative transfer region lipoprotein (TIGR03751 family)
MGRIWINVALVFACFAGMAALGGCATSKTKLLTHNDQTMLDIWRHETGGNSESRLLLPRRVTTPNQRHTLDDAETTADAVALNASYTRTAQNEIAAQFRRLPNPDLVMYVFPHVAGTEGVPVPGYSTVFPFYQRVHYALPGERLEDF